MRSSIALLIATLAFQVSPAAQAQGTAFIYQGCLSSGGMAANGRYDVAFMLFTTNPGGYVLAGPVTNSGVVVANGLFTTAVDFGNAFSGTNSWLEMAVRTNGANAFITLVPRQAVTPVPYAITAANVSGMIPLSQLPANLVTNGACGVTISGSLAGYATTAQTATNLAGGIGAGQITSGTISPAYLPPNIVTNFGAATNVVVVADTANGHGAIYNRVTDMYKEDGLTGTGAGGGSAGWLWILESFDQHGDERPIVTMGQDFGEPNLDGFITAWPDGFVTTWGAAYGDEINANAGRFFGNSWQWQKAAPGADTRSMILKGYVQSPDDRGQGGGAIFETAAAADSPGNHGLFNNPWYVTSDGLFAMGNLTDASDGIGHTGMKDWLDANGGWVTIVPGGSSWSGAHAQKAGLVIAPQALVTGKNIVPGALEVYDHFYFTDNQGTRWTALGSTNNTVPGSNNYFGSFTGDLAGCSNLPTAALPASVVTKRYGYDYYVLTAPATFGASSATVFAGVEGQGIIVPPATNLSVATLSFPETMFRGKTSAICKINFVSTNESPITLQANLVYYQTLHGVLQRRDENWSPFVTVMPLTGTNYASLSLTNSMTAGAGAFSVSVNPQGTNTSSYLITSIELSTQ